MTEHTAASTRQLQVVLPHVALPASLAGCPEKVLECIALQAAVTLAEAGQLAAAKAQPHIVIPEVPLDQAWRTQG